MVGASVALVSAAQAENVSLRKYEITHANSLDGFDFCWSTLPAAEIQ